MIHHHFPIHFSIYPSNQLLSNILIYIQRPESKPERDRYYLCKIALTSVTRVHTILTGIADNLCESPAEEAWTRQRDPLSKRVVKSWGRWPTGPLKLGSRPLDVFTCLHDFSCPILRFLRSVPSTFRRRKSAPPEANPRMRQYFPEDFTLRALEAIARSEIWLKWICASTGKSLQNLDRWLLKTHRENDAFKLFDVSSLLQLYLCMLILSLIIWKHNLSVKMEEIL